ncbi:MAG: Sir2 family NAD-dependent protein deacetylase [Gammaproteobacteria bacterium]|nr:Sir2 family NAD-dependent protein deacetylase [Gammaproteobacteria bacterium]MDP6733715.1 Sir2 family NAD-dependent protein deacetylase [Gammaproteobacteria bacterium]
MTISSNTNLAELIVQSSRVVVFTGAGISTESGIPDFRSPGGVWSKMKPIQFQDFVADPKMREESWRRKFEGMDGMAKALPNNGHIAVAKLVDNGKVSHVITQNVDNLHQNSGVPDDKVIELHGNATYAKCLACGHAYEFAPLKVAFQNKGEVPDCEHCGGMIKTATISFGQPMPEREMLLAQQATLDCDLFIAIVSSLVVYPAASFPLQAKQHGAKLVILNREPTEMDGIADMVIHGEIGPVLSQIVSELKHS